MIHSVIFTNRFGRSLKCELGAPGVTCLAVRSISGLGPGTATVNIHDIPTTDGGYYGSSRYGSRNIVISFSFLDYDENYHYVPIEQTRHLAYSFFQPKTRVQVIVESDERFLMIIGVVEGCEPDIFNPNTTCQVSIVCPEYYFKLANPESRDQLIRLYSSGLFEFPFSNESLTRRLIQFGNAGPTTSIDVDYDGDSETGMRFEVVFTGETVGGTIKIANIPKGKPMENVNIGDETYLNWHDLNVGEQYIEIDIAELHSRLNARYPDPIYTHGNKIVISTVVGSKCVKYVLADGTEYNILGYLPHLEWIKIYPGLNTFVVRTGENYAGHFRIYGAFDTLYTGV